MSDRNDALLDASLDKWVGGGVIIQSELFK